MLIATAPASRTTPVPIPPRPQPSAELLEAVSKPLFRGEYADIQRHEWRNGMPFFGPKVSSTRQVEFTNEFNVLHIAGSPLVGYAATSYDDALRGARTLAYDWADPAVGGAIYDSVGVAVLQAKDGTFFNALIGFGDRETSSSELGYRIDRFDGNVRGDVRKSTDARAESDWTKPIDEHGKPVDVPAPPVTHKFHHKELRPDTLRLVPFTDMLKAVVDINNVYPINEVVKV